MTNTIAVWLGAFILAAIGLDLWLGLDLHIFLGRKFVELVQWVAFWR